MKKIYILMFSFLCNLNSFAFQNSEENKFLNFSDLHFDPFYDTTLVNKLITSEYTSWEKIFRNSDVKKFSTYGSDSNFPLLLSAIEDMSWRIPHPDFIIITGDFMSHNFNENFTHYSASGNKDSLNFFIEKTIRFITFEIKKYFPDEQIFPMLGNDDAYCGNYMIDPDGTFLNMVSEVWEPLVNKNRSNESFKDNFSRGGYCMVNFPGQEKYKLIILNTVFFSVNYKNLCGDSLRDPGLEELAWLEQTLRSCKDRGYKVWLSYHISPGIDIYGTIHGDGDCEARIFTTWNKNYNDNFLNIIKDYSEIVTASFAGHFHRDDFRVLYHENLPFAFTLLTPSISPIYGNNPSYKIFEYDKDNFELINYETYYLKNSKIQDSSQWIIEYNFSNTYSQHNVSVKSLDNIKSLIYSDTAYRASYIRYYTANNEETFSENYADWYYNWCGIGHFTREEYSNCLCLDSTGNKR